MDYFKGFKDDAMEQLMVKFDIKRPQNISNQDLQDFMKVIGYLKSLAMILEIQYSSLILTKNDT